MFSAACVSVYADYLDRNKQQLSNALTPIMKENDTGSLYKNADIITDVHSYLKRKKN